MTTPPAVTNPGVQGLGKIPQRRVSLRLKFTFFVILTIVTIMGVTTYLTYRQQQRSLRDEVVKRGATIARSLASSAAEAVLNDLVCAALIHETMPDPNAMAEPKLTWQAVLISMREDILGYPADAYSRIVRNAGVVEILMVDINGIIVAHNDIQMVSQPYQPPRGLVNYLGGPVQVQEYQIPAGEKRFDIAVPILVNRLGALGGKRIGVVHLRMSQKLVDQIVKLAAVKLLLATGFMLMLGAVAALVLANFLTGPINRLLRGVQAIATGDLNQEIPVTQSDELGDLTRAFNQMAASLREKEMIKGAFSTYVSSQVMDEVLKCTGRLALGGERKRVTVMFADIRGFTSMSESMQPEEVVSIINVYLSLQTEIVLRNGGMLDKFVGDCTMAVYGTPLARMDDSLRAVVTAIEIQNAIATLNQERKKHGEKTVTIGIGINTGDAVSGNMGSAQKMDYTVIGDTVNLAARLESMAEGGNVLISEQTYHEVQDYIVAEKLSPLMVKGKKEQVQVYCVKGLKAKA